MSPVKTDWPSAKKPPLKQQRQMVKHIGLKVGVKVPRKAKADGVSFSQEAFGHLTARIANIENSLAAAAEHSSFIDGQLGAMLRKVEHLEGYQLCYVKTLDRLHARASKQDEQMARLIYLQRRFLARWTESLGQYPLTEYLEWRQQQKNPSNLKDNVVPIVREALSTGEGPGK